MHTVIKLYNTIQQIQYNTIQQILHYEGSHDYTTAHNDNSSYSNFK